MTWLLTIVFGYAIANPAGVPAKASGDIPSFQHFGETASVYDCMKTGADFLAKNPIPLPGKGPPFPSLYPVGYFCEPLDRGTPR